MTITLYGAFDRTRLNAEDIYVRIKDATADVPGFTLKSVEFVAGADEPSREFSDTEIAHMKMLLRDRPDRMDAHTRHKAAEIIDWLQRGTR